MDAYVKRLPVELLPEPPPEPPPDDRGGGGGGDLADEHTGWLPGVHPLYFTMLGSPR